MTIFVVVVGGIYLGVFTPTEAAAVGAAGTGLISVAVGPDDTGRSWAGDPGHRQRLRR